MTTIECLAAFPSMEIRAVKTCEVLDSLGTASVATIEKWHSTTWDQRIRALRHVHVRQVSKQWLPAHLRWNPVRDRTLATLVAQSPRWIFAREIFLGATLASLREQHEAVTGRRIPLIVDVADDFVAVLEATRSSARQLYRRIARVRQLERQALSAADWILFVTDAAIGHYEGRHDLPLRHKAIVVPNSPMVPLSDEAPRRLSARLGEFLYVGTIDRDIRDFEVVLASDRHLQRPITIDCYTFAPSQNSYVADLQRRAEACRYLRLRFFDAVPNSQYAALLDRYQIGLIPHHRNEITDYTIPNKLYDYVDRGLEFLASDNPAVVAEVKRLNRGITYRGEDPESFAAMAARCCVRVAGGDAQQQEWPMPEEFYFGAELRRALTIAGVHVA